MLPERGVREDQKDLGGWGGGESGDNCGEGGEPVEGEGRVSKEKAATPVTYLTRDRKDDQ